VRRLTVSGLVLASAVAIVALPTAASGALSGPAAPTATAANSTDYQDSAGENPAAPDITTLTVSNTDAGQVSFRINVPNRATFSSDMLVALEVDTDNNANTGSPEGTEYAIEIFQGEAALFRWDGTNFTRRPGDPPFTSLLFSYQGGITIRMSAAELGNTKAFKFAAFVFSGIANAVVRNGRVTCVGRIGNARLNARVQNVVAGAATCTWNLPPNSKGKRIRGSVSLVFEGLRASQSFSARIG
jgi:hypothetical protein